VQPADDALNLAAALVAECGAYAAQRQAMVPELAKPAPGGTLSSTVVTEVDVEVERRVDAALAAAVPDDGLIGEEYADRPGRSGRTWHVDPVDGTLNYARRLGPWSVVLSAWRDGACELVAVYTQGSVYTARRGGGAFVDDEPLVLAGGEVEPGGIVRVPSRLAAAATTAGWLARSVDSSATELCQIADGRVTGTVRLHGHPRDLHGPALLVAEAGGVVTDLSGGPWSASSTGLVVSAAGAHSQLLDLVP
jgi:myo-inositol-1(or 4)-monophosphatase